MLAIISRILRARYVTYEVGNLRESNFSDLPFFLLPPINITTQILCNREISINSQIGITII